MFKLVAATLLLLFFHRASAAIQANETALYHKDTYYVYDRVSGARGQSVLYVYIADTNNLANAKKAIFFPHVDQFMRLEIKDSK